LFHLPKNKHDKRESKPFPGITQEPDVPNRRGCAECVGSQRLKYYLGPFEAYAKEGFLPETPLREEQPRLNIENFYYAQEDEVYAAAARDGFTWSIHRPHTVIGKAVGNQMNMGTTYSFFC
jgi:hypothetical protein